MPASAYHHRKSLDFGQLDVMPRHCSKPLENVLQSAWLASASRYALPEAVSTSCCQDDVALLCLTDTVVQQHARVCLCRHNVSLLTQFLFHFSGCSFCFSFLIHDTGNERFSFSRGSVFICHALQSRMLLFLCFFSFFFVPVDISDYYPAVV